MNGVEQGSGLSRRGLLRAGLVGSATIWAGGLVGCGARRATAPALASGRAALSPPGEEILQAVMPVVLGPLLPAEAAARTHALAAGLDCLDDYLAHLSPPLQDEARGLFATLEPLPVRLFLLGTTRPWSAAPAARIESFLRRARDSRLPPLRRAYGFLQSMSVLAWFDQPAAWGEIGYPGPPVDPAGALGGAT